MAQTRQAADMVREKAVEAVDPFGFVTMHPLHRSMGTISDTRMIVQDQLSWDISGITLREQLGWDMGGGDAWP